MADDGRRKGLTKALLEKNDKHMHEDGFAPSDTDVSVSNDRSVPK